jgi:Fe-S cluster assembly protein SufB
MLEWRLEAFRRWQQMTEPNWARVHYPEDRLSEPLLLCGAEVSENSAEKSRDVDPKLLGNL